VSVTETPGLPKAFDHYDVESVLGHGAMGTVYLARDRRIGRRVALKTLHIDRKQFDDSHSAIEYFSRLQREAELSGSLHHPNIVTLFEAGYEGDRISYLAIEFIDGESLLRLMKSKPLLPINQVLNIAEDVLRGLSYAHGRGIIHRDIKPANILVGTDGRARIADFGIARPETSNLTAAGALMGTPNYMSPEQVKGTKISTRSDLFSVGAMLYEMLTGKKPFVGDDLAAILYRVVHEAPLSAKHIRPDITDPLEEFVSRLMAKTPEERFATAGDALDHLRRVRGEPGSETEALPTLTDEIDHGRYLQRPEPPLPMARQNIPPVTFWSIISAALAGLLITVALLLRTASPPAVQHIPPEKLAEFQQRRGMLTEARSLFEKGKLDESAQAYRAILTKYPENQAARQGLDEALQGSKRVDKSIIVSGSSRGASKARHVHKPTRSESIKERLKRFFHL